MIQGRYGSMYYSENGEYGVVFNDGYDRVNLSWHSGSFSVYRFGDKVYDRPIDRPCNFCIANNGTVLGINIGFNKKDKSIIDEVYIVVYNDDDGLFFEKRLVSLPELICITPDGKYAAFETLSSKYIDADSVFVIDIYSESVIAQITKPDRTHLKELYFQNTWLKSTDINGNELNLYCLSV